MVREIDYKGYTVRLHKQQLLLGTPVWYWEVWSLQMQLAKPQPCDRGIAGAFFEAKKLIDDLDAAVNRTRDRCPNAFGSVVMPINSNLSP